MQSQTRTTGVPTPIWIALMVLGFVLFWPLGLITLAYLVWSGKMMCCIGKLASWKTGALDRLTMTRGEARATGNAAFDEYRETTLRRLEEERQEFTRFLERLRRAKDQEEFDRFMSEQAAGRPAERPSPKAS